MMLTCVGRTQLKDVDLVQSGLGQFNKVDGVLGVIEAHWGAWGRG